MENRELHNTQKTIRRAIKTLKLDVETRDIPFKGRMWWVSDNGYLLTKENGLDDDQALAWLRRRKAAIA